MGVEPIPGEPAALAQTDGTRLLVVADYHAGIEIGLQREGVEIASRADERRSRLDALLDRTDADRLVVLGDLAHAIGTPSTAEREEIWAILDLLADRVQTTVVRGNHDGAIEDILDEYPGVSMTPGDGVRLGSLGFAHGHTWPSPEVLSADTLCMGHEHPVVRLEDEVGGGRRERAWLRGDVRPDPFREFHDEEVPVPDELVVFPAFNDLSGGTWVNVEGRGFLSPFLPAAFEDAQAYLLDGTRLGQYRAI